MTSTCDPIHNCNATSSTLPDSLVRGFGRSISLRDEFHKESGKDRPIKDLKLLGNQVTLLTAFMVIWLLSSLGAAAQTNVLITEIMASNTQTLADEDGDFEDWIEIYNAGTNTVNLNGWFLRDSGSIWPFPETTLGPSSFLIVFASSKDRRIPGRELHTNFKLERNGEYLALLYPDGVTISSGLIPNYPIQANDISYGFPVVQTPITLVSNGAPAKFLVPPPASMDTDWTFPGYDDSGWMAVNNGIGFESDAAVTFAPVQIGDSVAEFSGNQGGNNWFFGYWDRTSDNDALYNPTNDFTPFPRGLGNTLNSTNYWDGTKWDWAGGNPPSIEITSTGGQPSGNNGNSALTNHWAIRRWVSKTNGAIRITGTLACSGQNGTCGDGTVGRIIVDGKEVFQRAVFGTSVGYSVIVTVNTGSFVDFVIDAGSANNDLCDSTTFTAIIRTAQDSGVVADSLIDWPGTALQGVGGWSYGYWIKTNTSATYSRAQFVPFPSGTGPASTANFWDGAQWHWFDGDPPYDTLGQILCRPSINPSGTTNALEHWVIRRWVSEITATITIDWHFSKKDLTGEGTVAKVFRNGTQIDTISLTAADFVGSTKTIAPFAVVEGDAIDFTVEPGPSTAPPNSSFGDICFLNAIISGSTTLANQFASDVGAVMRNNNSSAYLRIPFIVTNLIGFDTLTLRMKYDDGIVVYLNGSPVADRNAPEAPVGNSAATASVTDAAASQFEEVSLTGVRDLLKPGTNILAIQGLNSSAADGDFLALVELRATLLTIDTSIRNYFAAPSPGSLNGVGSTNLGPLILDVAHTPHDPSDNDDVIVTARIVRTVNAIGTVRLNYRVMFGSESNVVMFDDGLHGDGAAGDGIYGAIIPNTLSGPGEMIRYYVTAADGNNNQMREPPFPNAQFSSQYLGTVVRNPNLTNPLPVVHLFITPANLSGANGNRTGRYPGSIYWMGEFYDNIGLNLHGQSSSGFPVKSYNVDFNSDHHFKWKEGERRVGGINMLTSYPDKAHIRNFLAYQETFRPAGSPYHFVVPVRVQTNGGFFGIWHFVEKGDQDFLKRMGRDPNGALYKPYNTFTAIGNTVIGNDPLTEKKTRKFEGNDDLVALFTNVNSGSLSVRTNYMYDNIDISEMINSLAARSVTSDWDCCHKNYYLYRDTEGSGEWQSFPWDIDLSFGRNWSSSLSYWDPAVYPGNRVWGNWDNNGCFQVVLNQPAGRGIDATHQMYLRRCRTLMDELQQTNGTPASQLHYETQIDGLASLIAPDAALDLAKWGTWGDGTSANAGPIPTNSRYYQSLSQSVSELKTNYLPARRTFIFNQFMGLSGNDLINFNNSQPTNVVILLGAIDYNPASANQAEEYIQLINTNRIAVDISGWTLSGAVEHTFQGGVVIPSSNSVYVVANKKAFRSRSTGPKGGMGLYVEGPYRGQLSARGESIILTDRYGHSRTNTYTGNPSPAQLYLRITEVMFHPRPDPGALPGVEEQYEYIELKNISTNVALNLTGIHFTNGIEFSFTGSAVTALDPGQTVLIVKNTVAFAARYGGGFRIAGQYIGSLDNAGEALQLDDAVGEKILEFNYDNKWYPITDGAGTSLVIADEKAAWNTWDKKSSWRPSAQEGGSPGVIDPSPATVLPILINEILTHTDPPASDAIELYNTNNVSVDISGWFLTDNLEFPKLFRIPNGTSIAANGYIVFYASNSFGSAFNLSSHGEQVYLFSGGPATNLTGYLHGFDFGAQANGVTFGRYINSSGKELFPAQKTASLGSTNVGPKVGPIVFSAINYHPPDLFTAYGLQNNEVDEFVELENTTAVDQPLFDPNFPTNTWQLRGGINFTFPTNVTIPAGGHALVVSFDPSDPVAVARFSQANQIALGKPLFGPFDGHLNNSGDNIELARPDVPEPTNAPDANQVFYVLVDKVEYSDSPPWATLIPGSFLRRFSGTGFGNDATNWVVPVAITVQPQSQVVRLPDVPNPGANVTFNVSAAGSLPIGYQWRFNGADIPGANSTALNLSNASYNQAGDYSVVVNNSYSSSTSTVARLTFYTDFGWRFVSVTGNIGSASNSIGTNLLIFMQSAGDAYVDDISLVPSSGPYAGINVITNGDFEAPLSGPWAVPVTMPGSMITNFYAHSGSSSLHVVATNGGSTINSIKQPLPAFNTNIFCTLSFWYHTLPTSATLNVRTFPGSALNSGTNVQSFDAPPVIASQPASLTVPPGGAAGFSVSAFGSEPFSYQWSKDGVPLADGGQIAGAKSANLTINNVQNSDLANYSVKVSNLFGSTNSSAAALTLAASAPIIGTQPQSQHSPCRGSVTFNVSVSGSQPLSYQWSFNHGAILNATNASLTLTNLSFANNGAYSVTITNSLGATNSSDATLVVDDTAPGLIVRREGTNLVVSWAKPCATYQLEEAASLSPASWSPATATMQETETTTTATIPITNSKRFYRLRR